MIVAIALNSAYRCKPYASYPTPPVVFGIAAGTVVGFTAKAGATRRERER